jgi:hypothetical protein
LLEAGTIASVAACTVSEANVTFVAPHYPSIPGFAVPTGWLGAELRVRFIEVVIMVPQGPVVSDDKAEGRESKR